MSACRIHLSYYSNPILPYGSMLKLCLLMAAILDGGRVTAHKFESILPKDHPCHLCFKLADWLQKRRLLNNFTIGSYVKTMSADGGHFEPRSGSHLRTIHAMFALNWLTGFRGNVIKHFPIGSYVKTMSADGGHLGWRSGSQDIILKVDHLRTIHVMFALN